MKAQIKRSSFYHSWLDRSRVFSFIETWYPLSFSGSLLLLSVIFLLGFAYAGNNLYALTLSGLGFIVLCVLVFMGRLQAFRLGIVDVVWREQGRLVSRHTDGGFEINSGDFGIFYFFRLHFRIHGVLEAGRDANMFVRGEGVATRAGHIFLPFYSPVCGQLDLRGRLMVRDVFGLTRTRVSPVLKRQFSIAPPSFPNQQKIIFKNSASMDSKRRMFNAEEEKYYMREYVPGDRIKDINWKASFRFNELITKIAPRSPEDSKLLHIELRHFTNQLRDCAESILHLNYLKSWMLSFLWQILREHPTYSFKIFTADEISLIENETDLELFSAELGRLQYAKAVSFDHQLAVSQEKFIFTTIFDQGLSHSLASEQNVTCNVFRTIRGTGKTVRKIRLLPLEQGQMPMPGKWVFRKAEPLPSANNSLAAIVTQESLKTSLF